MYYIKINKTLLIINLRKMKYRKQVIDKLEKLDSSLKTLRRMVNRQEPVSEFLRVLEECEEKIDTLETIIRTEPVTDYEVN